MSAPPPSNSSLIVAERILVGVGAALLAISPYLAWVKVLFIGDINLPGLLAAGKMTTLPAYLVTTIGVGLVLASALTASVHALRVIAITTGSTLALLGATTVYGLIGAVDATHGLTQVGSGMIVAAAGCIFLLAPPIIGLIRVSHEPWPDPRPHIPALVPLIVAGIVASCYAFLPLRASLDNYCGDPIASQFKTKAPAPAVTPNADMSTRLQSDQAQLASAQQSAAAQQATDSTAQQEQAGADQLSAKAQKADDDANAAAAAVTTAQATVDTDQASVDSATSAVATDQSGISTDQNNITTDQNNLATDQQNGSDPTSDQQALANDQQTLTNDQRTQATDQDALSAAVTQLARDKTALASDQDTAAQAQTAATSLDEQAQTAQSTASQDGATAGNNDAYLQQQVDQAQQQLATDQQNWQDIYQSEVTSAQAYNSALSTCQAESSGRLLIALIVAIIGIVWALALGRRHQRLAAARYGIAIGQ